MRRSLLPTVGLVVGFAAFAVWVAGVPIRALDALVLALFAIGLACGGAGYALQRAPGARRAAVVAIGVNGFGLAFLAILWGAG